MKKICVVTSARSEYGLLRWVIDGVYHNDELKLQLVVTGAHLSEEHGNTVQFIEKDGYPIAVRVNMHLSTKNKKEIVHTMGYCSMGMADAFTDLGPDIVVVLGDRYELLPIVSAAVVMNIPVAHISGGDVTEGAIDNKVRNAVTMMSTLHFPGTKPSYDNICRMTGSNANVYVTGETNIDNFEHFKLLSRKELAESLSVDYGKQWVLVTLHPETMMSLDENLAMAKNMIEALPNNDVEIIITQSNADFGGVQMNEMFIDAAKNNPAIHFIPTLGQFRYLSFMKEVVCVVGNSSSGIVETPHLGVPTVNIGDRQKGRHLCGNIISCGRSLSEITNAVNLSIAHGKYTPDIYFGDGHASEKIVEVLSDYIKA
ncbi:MAG: UDP-N-acetylglucosamine 2-epimerase (hydrolyzing) [Paludibacteraceae bacterium]|nr:UDP-N-acetylglucosamine 2-epimerase (hydrolyzing) [Paludibacteraceae bacterium]